MQSILEGRTDCPISGVFGAGKIRAAAAMIVGLLVMDPSLKVMVVTKENAASPPLKTNRWVVGVTELEKDPAN